VLFAVHLAGVIGDLLFNVKGVVFLCLKFTVEPGICTFEKHHDHPPEKYYFELLEDPVRSAFGLIDGSPVRTNDSAGKSS